MPRAPRIEYPGAIYHVMNRGNRLERIFKDDVDRSLFIKTLGETARNAGWSLHSYVLMRNHYHLLIETHRSTLAKGMQYLNSTYTLRYNRRHKTRGHLFQGRYKALLVQGDDEGYFLMVSDYIHLNPVRIGKAQNLAELIKDPWNSAGWLLGKKGKLPPWLKWQRVFGELGFRRCNAQAKRHYRQHLTKWIDRVGEDQAWKKIRRGWCLGSPEFVEKMRERLVKVLGVEPSQEDWQGEIVEEGEEHRATRLLKQALKQLGNGDLSRLSIDERYLLATWIRDDCCVGIKWLTKQFGLKSMGGMRSSISRMKRRIGQEPRLRSFMSRVTQQNSV